jgi:hypothetical protein
MRILSPEDRKRAQVQHDFALAFLRELQLNFPNSQDLGTVLSMQVIMFMKTAPTKTLFEEYKKCFLECVQEVEYKP